MNARLESVDRIILSIGHGGLDGEKDDPGAISHSDEQENAIAASLIHKLEAYLRQCEINNLIIPDYGLKKSIRHVNKIGNKDSDWAIEIHKNSTSNYDSSTMTQQIGIYYHPTSNGSKNIAEEMKKYMKENGAGSGSWIRSDEESNNGRLGWIRELKMLSHIIEAGFMEDDTSESSNDFYAKLIAGAICMALDKVFVP